MRQIAMIVDSGADVPKSYQKKLNIAELPLLTAPSSDVAMGQPLTSMPNPGKAVQLLERLHKSGVRQVLAVTISSQLSGTCGMLRGLAPEFPDMDIRVVDSRSVGIGAGAAAIRAAELARQGVELDQLESMLLENRGRTHIFLSTDGTGRLQRGGRLGPAVPIAGGLLGFRPILSCDRHGTLQLVKKVRGVRGALAALVRETTAAAQGLVRYRILVAHCGAEERAKELMAQLQKALPRATACYFTSVGPALAAHTGPGMVGAGVYGY